MRIPYCACSLLLIVSVFLSSTGVMAQPQQTMDDPLFGIEYDPQSVHFEEVPQSIHLLCPGLRDRKLWIYARWDTTDVQYFIVSGFMKFQPDGPGRAGTEPAFGTAVSLRGGKCTEDQSEYFLRGEINPAKNATPIKVPEDILADIAMNALERYAKAFGGKANFLKHLSPSDKQALPPVLQKQLVQFEKEN
jgi:hypothetical protein